MHRGDDAFMARSTIVATAVTSGLSLSQMPWYAHLLLGLAALAVIVYEQTLRYRWLVKLAEKFGRIGSGDVPDVLQAATRAGRRPRLPHVIRDD